MEIYNFLPKNSLTFVGNSMTTPLAQKVCSWERGDIDISFFLKNLTFSFRNSRKNLGKWVKWPEGVKKTVRGTELAFTALLGPPKEVEQRSVSPFIFPQKKCFLLLFALQQIFLLRGPAQHKMGGNNNTFFPFSRKSDRVQRSLGVPSPLFFFFFLFLRRP